MAGLNIDPNAIATARQAGYSDADIVAHLAQKDPSAFKKATDAGYSPTEILQHFTPDTSIGGGIAQGAADTAQSVGQSLDQLGLPGGQTAQGIAQAVAPTNYQPAQVVQNGKLNTGDIPRAVAEQGANIAAPILTGRIASKLLGPKAGLITGLGTAALEMFGPNVLARAKAEGHDTPTTSDKLIGGGTTAAQLAAQSLALKRFMPGANPVTSTGAAGAMAALKKGLITAGTEGASGVAQSALGQAGATAGTPGGLSVDPSQLASAGITNAIGGGVLAAPRVVADANNARFFREVNPELADAAQGFSQRMSDAAGGRAINTRTGEDVFQKARTAVNSELGDSIKAAGPLPQDASNILDSIKSGARPTDADYATLQAALQGNPQAAPLMYLAKQAHVASLVNDMGGHHDGSFVGGISPKVASLVGLSGHGTTKAVMATLLAEHFGSHLITHAPAAIATGLGVTGGARLIDNLTGARNPVQRFMTQFAPNGQARMAPVVPPQPVGPTSGPTGPRVPLNAGITGGPLMAATGGSPFANAMPPQAPPVNEAAVLRGQIKDASDLMAARRANEKQTVQQAMPAIAQLAARAKAQQMVAKAAREQDAQYAAADAANRAFDRRTVRDQMADASALMAARKANAQVQRQQDTQYEAANKANVAFDRQAQREQTQDASAQMAARRSNLQQQIAEAQAFMAARNAHLNPSAGDRAQMRDAKELMAARAANATDEEAEAPVAKVTKANGKVKAEKAEPAPALSEATPKASAFQPLPTNERIYEGMDHGEVAEAKINGKYAKASRERKESIRSGIIQGRIRDEEKLTPIMEGVPGDYEQVGKLDSLLQELHHTSSRSRAKAARDYYASQLPKETADKVRNALTDGYIERTKHRD